MLQNIQHKESVINHLNNETPLLCDHCKAYGYCIGEANVKLDDLFIKPASEREIRNWVNVQTEVKEVGSNYSKKLQQAHDLFHQEDFEQASYLYLDIQHPPPPCTEAAIGLSASYYFLGYFNKALSYASYLPKSINQSFLNRFCLQCEIMSGRA